MNDISFDDLDIHLHVSALGEECYYFWGVFAESTHAKFAEIQKQLPFPYHSCDGWDHEAGTRNVGIVVSKANDLHMAWIMWNALRE